MSHPAALKHGQAKARQNKTKATWRVGKLHFSASATHTASGRRKPQGEFTRGNCRARAAHYLQLCTVCPGSAFQYISNIELYNLIALRQAARPRGEQPGGKGGEEDGGTEVPMGSWITRASPSKARNSPGECGQMARFRREALTSRSEGLACMEGEQGPAGGGVSLGGGFEDGRSLPGAR